MDDGADLPCQLLFSHPEVPGSFDELFNSATTTCTHTHSCNPPGPEDPAKPRRPLGNREAVRKYWEKKKTHAAFLEEEVKKLRAANQQLLRRLQDHAALEAEVVRLRSLLLDVRGKIDAEVSASPFQKPCSVGSVVSADPAPCFNGNSEVAGAWEESFVPSAADCRIDEGGGVSREIDVPEGLHHSMDVVANFVSGFCSKEQGMISGSFNGVRYYSAVCSHLL
ncbi:hypothetical protein GQ55_5G055700 [Panicum hallii var. hallii]|uniref:BZIP domain-containing protein n=1 Tax=Panicum hallii var. hallii TaxID=1504633 RepID=A0A2T7DD33_9POAL|nr:hypothetical protein GQ55_5G055700 [Panicum hallii var. hallii]